MKERTLAGKIGYGCFYLGLLIELAIVILDKSDWQNVYESRLFRLTFCLFAVTALCGLHTYRSLRETALTGAMGLVSFLSWRISGRDELVRFFVFAVACRNIPLYPMMKRVFFVTAAGCGLLVFLSAAGIYGARSLTLDFGRGMVQTRYCLGMGHPNALHCMFLMLLVLGLYLYGKKIAWWGYLLLAAANFGVYWLTDSRIGTAVGLGTVALGALIRFAPGLFEKRWVYGGGCLVIAFLPALSAWLTVHYSHALDRFLNLRIWNVIAGANAGAANWTLFSGRGNDQYFDMGFIRIFYWYGIVPGILIIAVFVALCWYAGKRRDAGMLLVLVSCAAYTVAEAHLVSVYIGRNYPLMLLGCSLGGMFGRERLRKKAEVAK